MYVRGFGGKKKPQKGLELLVKSAEKGDIDAHKLIGSMYYQGMGVQKNDSTALGWYLKAARLGDADSQSMVSRMYHDGVGTRIDYLQARMWAEKGAEQGEIDAISLLGVMKYRGEGGNKDVREAKKLAEKGADAGNAEANRILGMIYFYGDRGTRDLTKAQKYAEEATLSGCRSAWKLLRKIRAEIAKENPCQENIKEFPFRLVLDHDKLLYSRTFRPNSPGKSILPKDAELYAAEQELGKCVGCSNIGPVYFGCRRARGMISYMYRCDVSDEDAAECRKQLEEMTGEGKLGERGEIPARRNLGVMYVRGFGGKRKPREGLRLLVESAGKGDIDAHKLIGSMYYQGIGVK